MMKAQGGHRMTIIHLEPEEFVESAYLHHSTISAHPFVLDNGVACMVYLLETSSDHIYYMDRPANALAHKVNEYSSEQLHAELYRKVALDCYLRQNRIA